MRHYLLKLRLEPFALTEEEKVGLHTDAYDLQMVLHWRDDQGPATSHAVADAMARIASGISLHWYQVARSPHESSESE